MRFEQLSSFTASSSGCSLRPPKFFAGFLTPAVAFCVCFGMAVPAFAHHPTVAPSGTSQNAAGPILTIPATTLPENGWGASISLDYRDIDNFSSGSLEALGNRDIEAHGLNAIWLTTLAVAYGVTDDVMVSASLPYIRRTNVREVHNHMGVPEIHENGDAGGIGDLALFAQWRFLNLPVDGFSAAGILGFKTPTGETDEKTAGGDRFETEFQPGSGSWDPILGFAVTQEMGSFAVSSNVIYRIATEGSHATNLGDGMEANVAVVRRLAGGWHAHADGAREFHSAWSAILELNGEWRDRQETAGVEDAHSGGYTLYLTPGVRYSDEGGWSAWAAVGYPVAEGLNGAQAGSGVRLLFGASRSF